MAAQKKCAHHWRPFSMWKAKCDRCGRTMPWSNIVMNASNDGYKRGYRDGTVTAANAVVVAARRHVQEVKAS
jgi:hypothetical protein